jgi:glycerol-3-phosphate dehydrogenase
MLEKIEHVLGARGKPWTRGATLPGGDFDKTGFAGLLAKVSGNYPFLSAAHARRLVRLYGTDAMTILGKAKSMADLGRSFGTDLTEAEVTYLIDKEWACAPEDILWRRTKTGLKIDADGVNALEEFLKGRQAGSVSLAAQ